MARIFMLNRCRCGRIKGFRWFLFMYIRAPVHMGCKGCYKDAKKLAKKVKAFIDLQSER